MRRWVLGAWAVLALVGCGGEPVRTWGVAVEAAPLGALPASCYRGSVLPARRELDRNLFEALRWTEWQAEGERRYLELASPPDGWPLGDAPAVALDGSIAGTGEVFEGGRDTVDAAGNVLRRVSVKVTFVERGEVARGTLDLASEDREGGLSCSARLAFTARELPRDD